MHRAPRRQLLLGARGRRGAKKRDRRGSRPHVLVQVALLVVLVTEPQMERQSEQTSWPSRQGGGENTQRPRVNEKEDDDWTITWMEETTTSWSHGSLLMDGRDSSIRRVADGEGAARETACENLDALCGDCKGANRKYRNCLSFRSQSD